MDNVLINFGPDHQGRIFDRELWIDRDEAYGPGYYIFGRDRTSMVCKRIAQPDVPARTHPHYNIKVKKGWKTQREALQALEYVKTQMPQDIERWYEIDLYSGMKSGGCCDMGTIKLREGFVLVTTEELDSALKERQSLKDFVNKVADSLCLMHVPGKSYQEQILEFINEQK